MFQGNKADFREISERPFVRAAAYVRMSRDTQQYSIGIQLKAINDYAASNSMQVVHTYADPGKSGLRIEGRFGLQALLDDIQSGRSDFDVVLVYDISRWGRFQDLDESAYYEQICRKAGLRVIYCAEQFKNDGSPFSAFMKMSRRMAAAEYSRDLSTKVFLGQCQSVIRGYWSSGPVSAGFRRCLIDPNGKQKGLLGRGEHKAITTDRTVVVLGPKWEIDQVRRAYQLFVDGGYSINEIAKNLNNTRVTADDRVIWTPGKVRYTLRNEIYLGNIVYNRRSNKLRTGSVPNPPEAWLRHVGACQQIIPPDLFSRAQDEFRRRRKQYTKEFLLERLADLLRRKGDLSRTLMMQDFPTTPSLNVYYGHFRSLTRAFEMVGYCRLRAAGRVRSQLRIKHAKQELINALKQRLDQAGVPYTSGSRCHTLLLNGETTLAVNVAYCSLRHRKQLTWFWRHTQCADAHITFLARMAPGDHEIFDYYAIPLTEFASFPSVLNESNKLAVDAYRVSGLDWVVSISRRVALEECAV